MMSRNFGQLFTPSPIITLFITKTLVLLSQNPVSPPPWPWRHLWTTQYHFTVHSTVSSQLKCLSKNHSNSAFSHQIIEWSLWRIDKGLILMKDWLHQITISNNARSKESDEVIKGKKQMVVWLKIAKQINRYQRSLEWMRHLQNYRCSI